MKEKNFMKKNLRWIVLGISIFILVKIVKNLWQNEIYLFDNQIYDMVSHFIAEPFTGIAKFITTLGSAYVIVPVCMVTTILFWKKGYGKYIIENLFFIFICNQVLKRLIQRPRPTILPLVVEKGFSFPSGHSMVSMAFYGLFMYLIYKKVNNKKWKWIGIIGLSILILAIGLSRIYLGVHYASDVVAGFCISLSYLTIFTTILKINKGE